MKRTLLCVLALIAVGCADAEQSETASEGSEQVTPSASCPDISGESPLEDVGPSIRAGRTDENGRVFFGGIEPGSYLIEGLKDRRAAQDRIGSKGLLRL